MDMCLPTKKMLLNLSAKSCHLSLLSKLQMVSLVPLAVSFAGKVNGPLYGLRMLCYPTLLTPGRQHLGALFNLVAYYVLALPMGLALAFCWQQGLRGLWTGQTLAYSFYIK
jgi:hypothetical protein